jgi:starch synthase
VILDAATRVGGQKLGIALQNGNGDGRMALEQILEELRGHGVLILLGTGLPHLEVALLELSRRHEHFVFLNLFSNACAEQLFENGDFFLMPSSFEPGGLSNKEAMRAFQPCIVHAVGGLKDSVRHGIDGLAFSGDDPRSQADAFVAACRQAIRMVLHDRARWARMSDEAGRVRFLWSESVRQYIDVLYR